MHTLFRQIHNLQTNVSEEKDMVSVTLMIFAHLHVLQDAHKVSTLMIATVISVIPSVIPVYSKIPADAESALHAKVMRS